MNQTMWLRCSVVYFIAFLQKPFPIFFFGSHSFRLLIHTDASLRSSAHTDFGRVSKQWFTSSQSTAETERSRKTGMEGARWTEFTANFEVCNLRGLQPICGRLQFPRSSRQYSRTKKNRPLTHGGQRTKNKIRTQILVY